MMRRGKMWFGLLVLLIGVFWLLKAANVLSSDFLKFFWPAVVIVVGFALLLGHSGRGTGQKPPA